MSIACRDRSRSETELNMFACGSKHADTGAQKPAPTLTGSTSVANAMSAQQCQSLATSDNIGQTVSGSVNEGSGSVISALVTSRSSELSNIADRGT